MGADEICYEEPRNRVRLNLEELEKVSCPFCGRNFNSADCKKFNKHIEVCGIASKHIYRACTLYPPSQDIHLMELIQKFMIEYLKKILYNQPKSNLPIQDKIRYLKEYIKPKKIPIIQGNCTFNITRQNILEESMHQISDISFNFYKELKIKFIGEDGLDAGGILREWYTNIFEILESDKLKLFIPSDSRDFSYIINPFLFHNTENYRYLVFIGKIIAKAIYQNITVNICWNKLIYKMILKEKIIFQDLIYIDFQLYTSIKNIIDSIKLNKIQNPNFNEEKYIEDLCLTYSLEMKDCYNHLHSFELIPNGKNIPVLNLNDYVTKRINFLYGLYEPLITKIRDSIFYYLPEKLIYKFSSDDLESLINGSPYIDIVDWRLNTIYKEPYNEKHFVIIWFWCVVAKLTQKQLSNLLFFSTGSSRVPIEGFKALESNRENKSKFTIEMIPYQRNKKNYIKAHTCFNRLDLPNFMTLKEVEEAVKFISDHEIKGFGLE